MLVFQSDASGRKKLIWPNKLCSNAHKVKEIKIGDSLFPKVNLFWLLFKDTNWDVNSNFK